MFIECNHSFKLKCVSLCVFCVRITHHSRMHMNSLNTIHLNCCHVTMPHTTWCKSFFFNKHSTQWEYNSYCHSMRTTIELLILCAWNCFMQFLFLLKLFYLKPAFVFHSYVRLSDCFFPNSSYFVYFFYLF